MTSILIAILGFLFCFGMVVFIHEMGHFLVAKWNDVEVEAFSLGMGPALFTFPYGETEYRICILPLGGYVKMTGEELAEREEEDDNPRSFHNQTVWTRVAILVAGATFNILLGYVIYVPYGMVQGKEVREPVVGYVPETMVIHEDDGDTRTIETPAHGNLQIGDRILSLNGETVSSFTDVTIQNELLGDQTRVFVIERNGEQKVLEIDPVRQIRPSLNQPSYIVGIQSYLKPKIDRVMEGSRAKKWGVEPGDRLYRLDQEKIQSWEQFYSLLQKRPGNHSLVLESGDTGDTYAVEINYPADNEKRASWLGSLGMGPKIPRIHYSFVQSFGYAWDRTLRDIELMYRAFVGLLTQRLSPRSLAGPLGIAQMTGQMALVGIWPLLRFTAFFSINLGVINLLPIPILDGGHIFLSVPEMLTGWKLPRAVADYANRLGLVVILTLFVFVTFIDLQRFDFFRIIFNFFGIEAVV